MADLTPDELRQVIEDNPVIAEMVDLAWEESAKASSEHKRRLLAQVVAAAMRGDTDTGEIDELQFLLRTVKALDPAHVSLLVVAMPRADAPQGRNIVNKQLEWSRWPGSEALLDAALAALEREGLIARHGRGDSPPENWTIGAYGRLFFDFLVRSGEAKPIS